MAAYTIAELCVQFELTPQIINGYVRSQGLPLVSDSPRKIDDQVLKTFLDEKRSSSLRRAAQQDKAPKSLKIQAPKSTITVGLETQESSSNSSDSDPIQNGQLLLWDKRVGGKGWAVGVAAHKEIEDDYISVIAAHSIGQPRSAAYGFLVRELQEGKLYLTDTVAVLSLVALQLERQAIADTTILEELRSIIEKLKG